MKRRTTAALAVKEPTLFDRLDQFARRAEDADPERPAVALLCVILAFLGFGLLIQVSHAATTLGPAEFRSAVIEALGFRLLALVVLLTAFRIGPARLLPFLPHMTCVAILMLIAVYLPGLSAATNGSRRWIHLPFGGLTIQPSEIARVVMVLWVAKRCVQLGDRVQDVRRGYLPMLLLGLVIFVAILGEPDVGGALLFLMCFVCTMWVGGARPAHVAGSFGLAIACALLFGARMFGYVRERFAVWVGDSTNEQVERAIQAMASGDWFGVGLTHGGWRNSGLQYMQSDYVFALVGEEFGYFGLLVVLGLIASFIWFAARLCMSIQDRFGALVAFGLLASVAFQAMLHVQVVTGLAPPKGMNLPFLSDGGSSLVASSLAVGLALGAARNSSRTGNPSPSLQHRLS